jgi:hypothetical protein
MLTAVGKRACGALATACMTRLSRRSSMSGARLEGGMNASVTWRCSVSKAFSPQMAGRPVSISYSSIPTANMSEAPVYVPSAMYSGAR